MRRVALTGGIASGKSVVATRLRAAGLPVVDADQLARDAVAPGTSTLSAVVARFGQEVLRSDGTLDRDALGRLVFADADARQALEALIHPVVRDRIEAFFSRQPPGTPVAVAEIPLLFETGRAADFDAVVVVACEPDTQRARLMRRNGLSAADAARRIAAQWPMARKVAAAHFVIRSDGPLADTERAADALAGELTAWAATPRSAP